MQLRIEHVTSYRYDQPVQSGLQQIRLRPKERAGQVIKEWDLSIDGGRIEASFEDQHNNHVDLVAIESGRSAIDIRCTGIVENSNGSGVIGEHGGLAPLWYFRRETDLTKTGKGVRAIVKELGKLDADGIASLHSLSALIRERVAYETGQSDSATLAEEALANGKGVCQDHAHIFIAAARQVGFPARYVSGYLMMNDRVEQDATHAWAEAHVDGIGWVGFDVSNGHSPDERYVRVATGLDYREASPVSGMRTGPGDEDMIVTLQVQQ